MFSGTKDKLTLLATVQNHELADLKLRHDALQKRKASLQELEGEKVILDQAIGTARKEIAEEQKKIEEKSIFDADVQTIESPDKIHPQYKADFELLLRVLKLTSAKFIISDLRGKFNVFESDPAKILFYKGNFRANHELEGQQAMDYFKSLGCKITENGQGHFGSYVVNLSSKQCEAAIKGLELLNTPSADEVAVSANTSRMVKC